MDDWVSFFSKVGVSPSAAKTYAAVFVKNKIGNDTLEDLDKESLHWMGITALGDIFRILKHAKKVIKTEVEIVEVKKEDIKKEDQNEEDIDEVMARVEADIPKWRSENTKRQETEVGHKAVARPSLYDRNKVTRRKAPMKPGAEEDANSSKQVKPMTNPRKVCQICKKSFSSNKCVNMHMNAVHATIKGWKGNKCYYTGSTKQKLKRHINAVHDKIKDWTCDKCPYMASQKEHLKRHISAVHDKIRNFKCDKCTYKASWKALLTRHMRVKH